MRFPDRERRRIATLRRLRPELEEVLDFLTASAELAEARVVTIPADRLNSGESGSPPLSAADFPLDENAAAEMFGALLEAMVRSTGSAEANAALSACRDGRLDAGKLARAYLGSDPAPFQAAAGRVPDLEIELLIAIAELAVKPQFIAAARAVEAEERPSSRGAERPDRCPVCGAPPDLVLITDRRDAERLGLAVCRLCETEWPVKRVRCLGCGNENADSLSYLQAEGEEDARIQLCEVCRRYLPILDTRGRLEVAPAVERVALAHLDVSAHRHGYEPIGDLPRATGRDQPIRTGGTRPFGRPGRASTRRRR